MGRGFGPKKQGPDLSWTDEDIIDPSATRATSPPSNVPAPLYPPRKRPIRTPVPLKPTERSAVSQQLQYRSRCRASRLFTVYDTSLKLVDYSKNVKISTLRRRAFDPFEGQDRYTSRIKARRTVPDLSERREYGFTLSMFPEELWATLDPEMKQDEWKGREDLVVVKKPKRRKRVVVEDEEEEAGEEDVAATNRKRRRKEVKAVGQKKGLDAEDEFEREDEGDDEEEERVEDSELEEDTDDEAENDYNAENYFSAGDEDEFGDGEAGMDDF